MVLALAWNVGTCRPDRAIRPVVRFGLRPVAQGRSPSSGNCEGLSTDAGHRGGPSRSSGEGPVMGLERRGRVVRACSAVNRLRAGGAG